MAKRRRPSGPKKRIEPTFRPTAGSGLPARSPRRRNPKRGRRAGAQKATINKTRFLKYFAEASVYVFVGLFAVVVLFAHFAKGLPDTDQLWRTDKPARLIFVASDGSPLRYHGQVSAEPIKIADLPAHVPNAILAIEDRNFYHHIGVNPLALVRALTVNARAGSIVQGGSTITQQLAKNLFLSSEKTYTRKFRELLLAFRLEQRFTKDQILTLYLNRVYFGSGAWGLNSASYRYFNKPAKDLSLAEAAIIAGLLKAPSRYAPNTNPEDAGSRGRLVVEAMMDAGFVSYEEAERAVSDPVLLAPSRFSHAPYFLDFVETKIRAYTDRTATELVIKTTIDPVVQASLQKAIEAAVRTGDVPAGAEAAGVVLASDGAILAMVGGTDYRRSQFNRAVLARRQPGSAFKPFVYLAALEQGVSRGAILNDDPIRIGNWSPKNYGDDYYGDVLMSEALERSLNNATVRLQEEIGRQSVKVTANRMGIISPLTSSPTLALGVSEVSVLELASAYLPFVNGGLSAEPYPVSQVRNDADAILFQSQGGLLGRASDIDTIETMKVFLKRVIDNGTGRRAGAAFLSDYGGKTGTTQNSQDAWFVGYAGNYVAAIWVGHDDNKPLVSERGKPVTGGGAPAIIWRETMAGFSATSERP